jgi:hypothetical protein
VSSPQIKVEILIPRRYNNKKLIPGSKLAETLRELTDRFGGSSNDKSVVEGRWVEIVDGKKVYYKDRNRVLMILCDDSPENHDFFVAYREKLRKRFEQRSILIVISKVEYLI